MVQKPGPIGNPVLRLFSPELTHSHGLSQLCREPPSKSLKVNVSPGLLGFMPWNPWSLPCVLLKDGDNVSTAWVIHPGVSVTVSTTIWHSSYLSIFDHTRYNSSWGWGGGKTWPFFSQVQKDGTHGQLAFHSLLSQSWSSPQVTGSEHTLPHLEHKHCICFWTCENESVNVYCAKRHWEASKLKMKGKIKAKTIIH